MSRSAPGIVGQVALFHEDSYLARTKAAHHQNAAITRQMPGRKIIICIQIGDNIATGMAKSFCSWHGTVPWSDSEIHLR